MEITPQIRREFDMFVANGMKAIHGEKTRDTFLNRIKSAKNPVEAVVDATLLLVKRLEAQREFDDLVLLDGSNILMGQLIEVAEAAGVHKFTDDERQIAYAAAIERYTKEGLAKGKYKKEDLASAARTAAKGQAAQEGEQAPPGATGQAPQPPMPPEPTPPAGAPAPQAGGLLSAMKGGQ